MITIAAQLFEASRGGIPGVATLMAKASSDLGYRHRLLSVSDDPQTARTVPELATMHGSRWRFVVACARAALDGPLFFDQLGTARAYLPIPGLGHGFACWIHGIEVWGEMRSDRRRAAARAALLVANSSFTREKAAISHPDFARADVCWLGTLEDEPAPSVRENYPVTVTIISRLDEARYKGHTELIAAWPQIVRAVPEAELLIVGNGPTLQAFQDLARRSDAAGNIRITGFIPNAGIAEVWRNSSVFAMPSRGEGFGLVYAEAMRWGVPVVASVHDAGREINLHGETGFNVDLDTPHELAERLISLLTDPALRRRFGEAGREHWRRHFRYSAFRERFADPLSRLASM